MTPAVRLKMLALAEMAPPRPPNLQFQAEGGLGGVEMGVDDHLKHAVHHAQASLTASRAGDHTTAAEHKKAANIHLGHASQKQNAEDHPGQHQGEKMVFGVWRKTGSMSPADHQKTGDAYTRHAHRQKARIDARAMMGGVHPSEIPEAEKGQHYHEVKQALAAAKTHYAGQDPMTHTGDAGVQRTGPQGKPPVATHGQASGGKHHSVPMQYPSQSQVGHSGAQDRADFAKHDAKGKLNPNMTDDPSGALHHHLPHAEVGDTTKVGGYNYKKVGDQKWQFTHHDTIPSPTQGSKPSQAGSSDAGHGFDSAPGKVGASAQADQWYSNRGKKNPFAADH